MPSQKPRPGEIYFQHVLIGIYHKVIAIDANTGVEVTIMGPTGTNKSRLEDLALQKLNRRLEKGG